MFDGGSWVGESGDAGRAAQFEAASIKDFEAEINRVASGLIRRGAEDVAGIKRHMFEVNKQAHQEAFAFLRSGSGQSLAQLAVVLVHIERRSKGIHLSCRAMPPNTRPNSPTTSS